MHRTQLKKLGVTPRTVERQIQTAKNLVSEAREIIRDTDTRLSKKAAMKLSRLEPDRQKEAAQDRESCFCFLR